VGRTLRRQSNLTQFETAQLGNLCPSTAEEAKSIIPRCAGCAVWKEELSTETFPVYGSLAKYDDDVLQPLLDELQSLRKFQD